MRDKRKTPGCATRGLKELTDESKFDTHSSRFSTDPLARLAEIGAKASAPAPRDIKLALELSAAGFPFEQLPPSIRRSVLDHTDPDDQRTMERLALGRSDSSELRKVHATPEDKRLEDAELIEFVSESTERILLQQEADEIDRRRQARKDREGWVRHLEAMGDPDDLDDLMEWVKSDNKRIRRVTKKTRTTKCPNRGGCFKSTATVKRKGTNLFKTSVGLGGDCLLPSCESIDCRRVWAGRSASRFTKDLAHAPVWHRLTVAEADRAKVVTNLGQLRRDRQETLLTFTTQSARPGHVDIWATSTPSTTADQWTTMTRAKASRWITKQLLDLIELGPVDRSRPAHINYKCTEHLSDLGTWTPSRTNGLISQDPDGWETIARLISTKPHDIARMFETIRDLTGMKISVSRDGKSAKGIGKLTESEEIALFDVFKLHGYEEPHRKLSRKGEILTEAESLARWENELAESEPVLEFAA